MYFILSEEQKAIQKAATDFSRTFLMPYASQWDQEEIFPIPVFKEAATLGFSNLYIPPEHGGCGLSRLDAVLVFEALSQGCVPSAAYLSIHNMVSWIISTFGTPEQRQRWLPACAKMETLGSYCLTEPSAGSDAASLKTEALRQGQHYRLRGEKTFISGGGATDLYIVMARTEKGISCFAVEKGTPGLSFGKPEKKMGWKSHPTTSVFFDNCLIPAENLIGQEGEGFKIAMQALDGGRLNIAACSLGGAQYCLNKATDYLQQRSQFGEPLSQFQALRFKIADMWTKLEASRLMVYRAASTQDTTHIAMAKAFATEACFQICDEALQLHGGYGYLKDYDIERYLRDLRVHRILEGTNEMMRHIISRKALGR